MAQLDNDVGLVMQKLKDIGVDDNTIVVFTTDNGTELFTWPDGGTTPFAQCKGTIMEGGFRVPCILRWPGHVPADSVQNGIFSGMDWFPTFLTAAGNPNITDQLLKGVKLGDRTYKNHLDGYDQMAASPAKAHPKRHEIFYLGESTVGAVRIDDYKFASSTNRTAGSVPRRKWTCPTSSTCASIRSSARAGPTMERKKERNNTSIGSSSSSGVLCSSSRWWARNSRLSSNSRRCRGARASTSRP